MDEIDLDFLKTPPKQDNNNARVGSPFVFNEFDVGFCQKKRFKRFELASNIAKVDELVQEIDKLKNKNLELQQQLKGLKATAQEVQVLYINEKNGHSIAKQDLDKLQKQHSKIDEDLANMILVNEQLKARLEEYDGRPISFENLLVKYVRVMTKFQEDDVNKYSQDKDLLERLREYCNVMKYKVPRAVSPKKSRSRGNKTQTREAIVQCDLFEKSSLESGDCSACKNKAKSENANLQCTKTKRDQASQYISTMVTRQTNTENIGRKHVQTMFPESPAIDDILEVYAKWSNIRSVSPLLESPPHVSPRKDLLKVQSTTGTCTMLCNIRRKIDYLPSNNSSNIKQEFFTPSASPTPNTDTTSTSGSRVNAISNTVADNINSRSLLNLFNSTTNSSLGQLSFNAFNELWQIFGKMLLSLIQNSDAGIATTNQSSHINQQQFLDWMLELYTNSKAQNAMSESIHTQTVEQRDTNRSVSPLTFNGVSVLSTNILRPQPQKILPEANLDRRTESIENKKEASSSTLGDCNSNKRIDNTVLSDISLESTIRNHIQKQQQNTSKPNKIQTSNICESNPQNKDRNDGSKSNQQEKTKYKILDEIQDLLPGIKLNKKKSKLLKRLLKSGWQRKKSYGTKKHKTAKVVTKQSPIVILTNDYNVEDTTETAVDFLKTFAVAEQKNQEDFSETEKLFFTQISNDKAMKNIASNVEESSNSLPQSSTATNSKLEDCKRLESKCQQLFGDSDSEEIEHFELNPKPVIKSNIDLNSTGSRHDNKVGAITVQEAITQEFDKASTYDHEHHKKLLCADGNCNPAFHTNPVYMPQQSIPLNECEFSADNMIQNTIMQISENNLNQTCHRYVPQSSICISENTFNSNPEISMPDLPTPILEGLEYTYLPNTIQFPDTLPLLNSSLNMSKNSFTNMENCFANDLELSSDVYCVEENNAMAANTNENSKTEDKIERTFRIKDTNDSYKITNIQDSTVETEESTIEERLNSQPILNEEESSNGSMKSQPIVLSSMTLYSSDFEKDFELSSDNESLNSENHLNDRIPKVVAEADETPENSSINEDSVNPCTLLVSEAQQTNHVKSFENNLTTFKESSNILLAKGNENNSANKFKPKNDCIPYLSSNKEQHKQNISLISSIQFSDSSELNSISEPARKSVFRNNRISNESLERNVKALETLSCQENVIAVNDSTSISSPAKYKTTENFKSNKQALNNHEEQPKTAQTISLPNSISESVSGTLKMVEKCVEENILIKDNTVFEEQKYGKFGVNCLPDENSRFKTKEYSKQLSNSSSILSSQSECSVDETVNSSVFPIKDASDSSSSNEIRTSEEIFKACNKKDLVKVPGLSSLKLLHLNKTLIPQKPSNSSVPNIKETIAKNVLGDNKKKIEIINMEEILPSKVADRGKTDTIDEIKEINDKRNCIYPISSKTSSTECATISTLSFSPENISEHKSHTIAPKDQEPVFQPPANKTSFEESFFTNNYAPLNNKVPIQYEALDELDTLDLSDSLSMEDELMIDEELNESTSNVLQTNPLEIDTEQNCNSTLDSSNISTLLNSSLYNEVLTESLKPIVNVLLQEDFTITSANCEAKSKRGRKRKSECLAGPQSCKRSQRLKAKQMILEESLNLSKTQIQFAKYPNHHRNVLSGVQQKVPRKEDINKKVLASKIECWQNTKILENENTPQLGFFRERDVEDEKTNQKITNKLLEVEFDKTYTICEKYKNLEGHQKQQTSMEILDQIIETNHEWEHGKQKSHKTGDCINKQLPASFVYTDSPQSPPPIDQNIETNHEWEHDGQKSHSPGDCIDKQSSASFVYTDSPQSPPPIEILENSYKSEKCVNIPLERPIEFMPRQNNPKLFDVLINSYKNEHQKQVLELIAHKEEKRNENILTQLKEQIKLYCNDEMDLDLYCTSTRLINKLLSLSPDYNLIQKAVIGAAQHADSPNTNLNDLPSIIQEMPPRHLSRCLQRLFTFLRIIVTRNSSFCHELLSKIENKLFNPKQMEHLSLQATLNLTQLYLMASKVQEYLQTPKHPARLFIAKCLYYYLQKSVLMIHEVLLWYPTVLPHREDKTYDRSDALISVIQQILMNTKYDMDNADLRGKILISKLRFEYHFEPFRPTQEEVIKVLVEKLKNSKFYNISLAFGLLCKRIGVIRTEKIVLAQYLMPLANEYYSLALKTNEYDKRIEVLLEIISMLVKPLPIETDTKNYFWEFARFLNGFERQIIQEAALCSILRLQRFNLEYCYSLLSHFQPAYNLNTHTQAMLKTFLYRRPLNFWKNLKSKNLINCN